MNDMTFFIHAPEGQKFFECSVCRNPALKEIGKHAEKCLWCTINTEDDAKFEEYDPNPLIP